MLAMLVVWILVIEASLQVTSLGMQMWMKHNQIIPIKKSGSFKIMCLGESTTAWGGVVSYPSFLQKKLDASYGTGFFQVINKGVPGANTQKILELLPGFLDEESPELVVMMNGVNNFWGTIDSESSVWERSLEGLSRYSRIAKLIRTIMVNIEFGNKSDEEMSRTADCGGNNTQIENFLNEYEAIYKKGNAKKSAMFLEEKIKMLTPRGSCSLAAPLQMKLINLQAKELNDKELALKTTESILTNYLIPYRRSEFLNIRSELRLALNKSSDDKFIITPANYWENSTYKVHIQKIVGEMQARKIPVIMMQYPRLPIGPIRTILLNHNDVSFLENKNNFEDALKTKTFKDLFEDQFGLVFGHFTPFGADLVAENVFQEIKRHYPTETRATHPGSIKR